MTQRILFSRLGTINNNQIQQLKTDSADFNIVTCSSLIEVKRVHLIILALEKVNINKKLNWIHFGTGNLKDEIIELAKLKLTDKDRISFRFMGQVPNAEVHRFYNSNSVHFVY